MGHNLGFCSPLYVSGSLPRFYTKGKTGSFRSAREYLVFSNISCIFEVFFFCKFQLEQSLYELRYELESLELNRKEIEENLRAAIKEYRLMEQELDELEDEYDGAISRIEKLEAEVPKPNIIINLSHNQIHMFVLKRIFDSCKNLRKKILS